MSYHGPRVKLSRRLGVALTPKSAKVMIRKPYRPGQHGQKRKSTSEYASQLMEKQRLKFQYNVSERQLRKTYGHAQQMKGNPSERLIQLLESRLDSVIYRAGFAPTVFAARQLVSHGHVLVNGKRVDIPSFTVSAKDVVSLKEKSRTIPVVSEALNRSTSPAYLNVNKDAVSCSFVRAPERAEVPVICDLQLVIEWYSR